MSDGPSAAVVGAGVAGLAAAWRLRRAGVSVRVYEAGARAGGVIRTERAGGFLAEHGPNSMAHPSARVRELLREAGLAEHALGVSPAAKKRYVVRRGRPEPVPLTPPALLTTRLLSVRGRLRVMREPWIAPAPRGHDESVAEMARRRLGPEALDYLIDPFVTGIYAGDAERLSARHAVPRLKALEDAHGSLLRGMIAAARARKTAEAPVGPPIFSFVAGMEEIPRALAAGLGGVLHLSRPVRAIRRNVDTSSARGLEGSDDGWTVIDAAGEEAAFDALVLAAPAHALRSIPIESPGVDLSFAGAVEHAPIAVVTLGFRRADVAHPLDGFGMLVPRVERRAVLGVLFSSTMFEGRAPEGHVSLAAFVGGTRHPELAALSEDRLTDLVRAELSALLGAGGAPSFAHVVAWPRGIPQYVVGHGEVQRRADEAERAAPGLFLAGSWRSGVSVGDSLASGLHAADAALAKIGAAPVSA